SAYVELHKLQGGHSDTINCVAFSPNGAYLASGGDDYALVIWNVSQGRQLYRTLFRSSVDYIIWHPTLPDTVIIGCSNGTLQQFHEFSLNNSEQHDINLGARSTIHYLDYDANSGRLAVSMGEEVHVTREKRPNYYVGDVVLPSPPAPEGMEDEDPRLRAIALRFHDDGAALVVSYLAHGISCWDTETQQSRWHIPMPDVRPNMQVIRALCGISPDAYLLSGGAAISPHHRYITVYNVKDGLDLYALGPQKKAKAKRSYKFDKPPRSKHLLQVKYVHRGHGIISGSTSGQVSIWETTTGEVCQKLEHGGERRTCIRPILFSHKLSYVATGTAACGQNTYIKIWRARI
ncbi:WD40 repeat-like protein, partial [Trametes versicolor FP-101664 SS1]|uniref:WD40 repeat-like protein n=1 Tax=Trametes versicolor (strain FP-101664) TaxID=717944 RepID=UPI00046237BE